MIEQALERGVAAAAEHLQTTLQHGLLVAQHFLQLLLPGDGGLGREKVVQWKWQVAKCTSYCSEKLEMTEYRSESEVVHALTHIHQA